MTLQSHYKIPELPPAGVDFQTPELLMALVAAHRYLAELKGCAASITACCKLCATKRSISSNGRHG